MQVEEISWSDDWKGDVCKLLKRRGFKEAEEGANELSHQKTFGSFCFNWFYWDDSPCGLRVAGYRILVQIQYHVVTSYARIPQSRR